MSEIIMPETTPKKPISGAFYGLSGYGVFSTSLIPNEFQDILVLGASILFRSLLASETKELMDSTYPNSNCTIHNRAISGDGTSDLRAKIDGILAEYTPTISNMAVIVHIGGNDVSDNRPYSTDTNLAVMSADYDYIINAIETAGYELYLSDITYRNYPDVETNNESLGSFPYNDNLVNSKVDVSKKFSDGQSWMQLYTLFYNDISLLDPDGIHPLDIVGEAAIRQRFVDTLGRHNFTGKPPIQIPKTNYYVIPNSITSTLLVANNADITVTWSDTNVNAYSYNIYRNGTLVATKDNVLGQTSDYSIIDDASVDTGTIVTYEVKAVNDTGESINNSQPQILVPDVGVTPVGDYKVSFGSDSIQDTIWWVAGIDSIATTTPQSVLNVDGDNDGVFITTSSDFAGVNSAGNLTGDEVCFLRESQMANTYYTEAGVTNTISISGFNDSESYTLRISGSRVVSEDRQTQISIGGINKQYYTSTITGGGNQLDGVEFVGISPINGEFILSVSTAEGSYSYIGGIDIINT